MEMFSLPLRCTFALAIAVDLMRESSNKEVEICITFTRNDFFLVKQIMRKIM